jgi:hypothetical protein
MRDWQKPWEQKHRTVRAVCVNCVKTSHITLYGLATEYRGMIGKETCQHCGVTGKLTTTDLAKTRPKRDTTSQLSLFTNEKKR